MISYSPSEGCIQSTLIVRTLWHQIFSRCYSASLLKPVLENAFAWILSGDYGMHLYMIRFYVSKPQRICSQIFFTYHRTPGSSKTTVKQRCWIVPDLSSELGVLNRTQHVRFTLYMFRVRYVENQSNRFDVSSCCMCLKLSRFESLQPCM